MVYLNANSCTTTLGEEFDWMCYHLPTINRLQAFTSSAGVPRNTKPTGVPNHPGADGPENVLNMLSAYPVVGNE